MSKQIIKKIIFITGLFSAYSSFALIKPCPATQALQSQPFVAVFRDKSSMVTYATSNYATDSKWLFAAFQPIDNRPLPEVIKKANEALIERALLFTGPEEQEHDGKTYTTCTYGIGKPQNGNPATLLSLAITPVPPIPAMGHLMHQFK